MKQEQTNTFKLCFISQFKCNGLHDSFEIPTMKYYNSIFAVFLSVTFGTIPADTVAKNSMLIHADEWKIPAA